MYYIVEEFHWYLCIGHISISASDNCSSEIFYHHLHENGTWRSQQMLCPNEITEWHSGSSMGHNVKINCKLEDWKIVLICTGVGLMVIFTYKVMRINKQRRAWRETTINQNVGTTPAVPTISINVPMSPPPSYFDLKFSWTSNSINAKDKTNDAVNSEENPPTYEEFLELSR